MRERERERERECMSRGGVERERARERIPSRLRTVSAGLGFTNCEFVS